MTIFQEVQLALAERFNIESDSIRLETELMELGVDSLDAAELLMDLEEKMGITIEPSKKLKTIKDVVVEIEAAVNAKSVDAR